MKLVNKELVAEKKRWKKALAKDNELFSDCVIGINDVIDAYFALVDYLFEAGLISKASGSIGAIDGQRLISVFSRQKDGFPKRPKWKTDYEKCATLFYGLIKIDPFHRFNSSTALLCMLFYLSKIGRVPTAHHKEIEVITRIIASNEIRQRGAFKPYSALEDGETLFLSQYLQENTRSVEKKDIVLTYSELNGLLEASDIALTHPVGQSIDVVRKQEPSSTFKLSKNKETYTKIGAIGFSGWTRNVPGCELRRLSEVAGLSPGGDVGSQAAVFNPVPHLPALIHKYVDVFQRIVEDDEKRSQELERKYSPAESGQR